MGEKISLTITKILLRIVYLILCINFMYWLYYMGHYIFHYELINIAIFNFPFSKSILIIILVIMAVLLEDLEKKLERKM